MRDLPSGTVTFLFTDIEGSTRLLRELGDGYAEALTEHRRLLREAFAAHGGVEVDTQGDAFFVAFADAAGAVAAAGEAQSALEGGQVRVRMGVHTGEPTVTAEGYVGEDVHLGARIAASGHGGQVLLSKVTHELVERADVRDLGEHRLKDFEQPVWIYQLGDALFPPLKTISNTNLPRPASSFVGREREVGEVVGLLREGARLVTLTGPGGSGKTRLAIEAAAELVGEFRNGLFWIGLATARDPELVLATVAQTLGAQEELAVHIGEKEILLLLDNLEQVVQAAPELAALVEACPNLRLTVTSRELLRVRGEVEYEVLPLADPDAVELFCARAGLQPSAAVEELCRRLDNMPLALELAAARTKALSPKQILERLGQRLDLFEGGRDADPRQATLRATIEWSHELLDPDEQRLFARLSVFPGCSLEAAAAVCDAGLDTMQSLVEKSLVRHTNERFWMLETIREFAAERLEESGEAVAVRLRHAEFFLELAKTLGMSVETIMQGAEQRHDLALLELDNLRAAVDWALGSGRVELAAELAINLENLWVTQDPTEGMRWFAAILEHADELPLELRAPALRCHGSSATIFGKFALGAGLYEQSLAAFRELGDEFGVAVLLHRVATEAFRSGDLALARHLAEQSLALHRQKGSASGEAQALSLLAQLEWDEGRPEPALELLERSVSLAHESGFRWWEANTVGSMAEWAIALDRLPEAEAAARRTLALGREMQDRQTEVLGLGLVALVAARTGRLELAGRIWGAVEAEELRGRIGIWEVYRDEIATPLLAASTPDFEDARAEGRQYTLDEAVDHALSVDSRP